MKKFAILLLSLSSLATVAGAQAADLQRGKSLHEQNCMSCHAGIMGGDANSIYTRPNRRINSYSGLLNQVSRCKDNLGVSWPAEEVEDVASYLNKEFYHFKKAD